MPMKNVIVTIVRGCLALALLFGPAVSARAAGADAAPMIRKLQSVYEAMSSFRADFTQELTHQESGTTETRRGILLFRKPLLVRWETLDPDAELLIVGEKEIWDYLPDEEVAYRYSLELAKDSRSLIMVVTGQAPLDRDFDVEIMAREPDDGPLTHLLLYPREPSSQLVEAQLWVDPETALIRRALIMDFYGNTNQIAFDSLAPDAPVGAADFAFTPPEGTEVEDHSGGDLPIKSPLLN